MTKIYTRTGDGGTTSLTDGTRIPKDDVRIEAYGTVDELNSVIGLARAHNVGVPLHEILNDVQNDLFVVGAQLATPDGAPTHEKMPTLPDRVVELLEEKIDALSAEIPALTQFILPGGSHAAALLHMARTVCRRAERHAVALARVAATDPLYEKYLNRLSDLLFVAARYANCTADVSEVMWKKRI